MTRARPCRPSGLDPLRHTFIGGVRTVVRNPHQCGRLWGGFGIFPVLLPFPRILGNGASVPRFTAARCCCRASSSVKLSRPTSHRVARRGAGACPTTRTAAGPSASKQTIPKCSGPTCWTRGCSTPRGLPTEVGIRRREGRRQERVVAMR